VGLAALVATALIVEIALFGAVGSPKKKWLESAVASSANTLGVGAC
jgi:hypothetical protein